ncbi:hypothetical protein [Paraburkholderia sp. BL25I1N1]|uniref:hypothetical protein n=1 Tax=Paraburkholderia sp. BL25I1N1 TaxID=1938804 RepID=UPI000D05C9C0|nr:hypothetical protein [Paraburkholderia sp. BL25I1N1]PRY04071.1 hypothetical protein B0G73_11360 [Paraburkholderia sp. BL25I1N1]
MTSHSAGHAVRGELRNRILVVTVDNPPVNALGVAVRCALSDAIGAAEQDPVFWQPSPLIVDLVERGATLASLNHTA